MENIYYSKYKKGLDKRGKRGTVDQPSDLYNEDDRTLSVFHKSITPNVYDERYFKLLNSIHLNINQLYLNLIVYPIDYQNKDHIKALQIILKKLDEKNIYHFILSQLIGNDKLTEESLDFILSYGDVNYFNEYEKHGNTLLLNYIMRTIRLNPLYIKKILEHGADPDMDDHQGNVPLIQLFKQGYGNFIELIKLFIEHNADLNIQDNNGATALHYATYYTYIKTAELLLDNGADPNIYDGYGVTPLGSIIKNNDSNEQKYIYLELLLKHGADLCLLNEREETPFESYVLTKNFYVKKLNIIKLLCIKCTVENINKTNRVADILGYIIIKNIRKNNDETSDILAYLLDLGLDINKQNSKGNTVLHYLFKNSNDQNILLKSRIIHFLIDRGADINIKNNKHKLPLSYYLYKKSCKFEMIKILTNSETLSNLPPNINFWQIIMIIIYHNYESSLIDGTDPLPEILIIFEYFLSLGADINSTDDFGNTILHAVCDRNGPRNIQLSTEFKERLVKFLLDHNINVKLLNYNRQSALQLLNEEDITIRDMIVENYLHILPEEKWREESLDHLRDPVTLSLYDNPHIASDGHTYSLSTLTRLFNGPNPRSPKTNLPLQRLNGQVGIPNILVRQMVEKFIEGKLKVTTGGGLN
uniref:U-box domain-containing protein n=1 Tax=viral metagenome TaxID=1070528 RepID=A0A6C0DAT8_9ZZZZ